MHAKLRLQSTCSSVRRCSFACAAIDGDRIRSAIECAAAVKPCPLNEGEIASGVECLGPGRYGDRDLAVVTPGAPQRFQFCCICKKCWTGVLVEAHKHYRLRVIGEPDSWTDASWRPATLDETLAGWRTVADHPDIPSWQRPGTALLFRIGARWRPVPDADWFQVFFAIRDASGEDSEPERLERREQSFDAPLAGELYFFANDHPWRYGNNTGRMILEISAET